MKPGNRGIDVSLWATRIIVGAVIHAFRSLLTFHPSFFPVTLELCLGRHGFSASMLYESVKKSCKNDRPCASMTPNVPGGRKHIPISMGLFFSGVLPAPHSFLTPSLLGSLQGEDRNLPPRKVSSRSTCNHVWMLNRT